MSSGEQFYIGNAIADQVRNSGWFVGQFVPAACGLRHQNDVEIKWGIHPDGEKRAHAWANEHATTISVLIRGKLRVAFHIGEPPQIVRSKRKAITSLRTRYGPLLEAIGDTVVLSVRFRRSKCGRRRDSPTAGSNTAINRRSRRLLSAGDHRHRLSRLRRLMSRPAEPETGQRHRQQCRDHRRQRQCREGIGRDQPSIEQYRQHNQCHQAGRLHQRPQREGIGPALAGSAPPASPANLAAHTEWSPPA